MLFLKCDVNSYSNFLKDMALGLNLVDASFFARFFRPEANSPITVSFLENRFLKRLLRKI